MVETADKGDEAAENALLDELAFGDAMEALSDLMDTVSSGSGSDDVSAATLVADDKPVIEDERAHKFVKAESRRKSLIYFTQEGHCHGQMLMSRFVPGRELVADSEFDVLNKVNTIFESIEGKKICGGGLTDVACPYMKRVHPKRCFSKRPGQHYACCYRHLVVDIPCLLGPEGRPQQVRLEWCDNFSGCCKMSPWHLVDGPGAMSASKRSCFFEIPRSKHAADADADADDEARPNAKKQRGDTCRCPELFDGVTTCQYPRCTKCQRQGCAVSKGIPVHQLLAQLASALDSTPAAQVLQYRELLIKHLQRVEEIASVSSDIASPVPLLRSAAPSATRPALVPTLRKTRGLQRANNDNTAVPTPSPCLRVPGVRASASKGGSSRSALSASIEFESLEIKHKVLQAARDLQSRLADVCSSGELAA